MNGKPCVEDLFYVGPIRRYIDKSFADIYWDQRPNQQQRVSAQIVCFRHVSDVTLHVHVSRRAPRRVLLSE